ncbi:BURP domain protein RD22-like [Bidens hawaiensis]|uniref:BURP domain protein RD22-like n=1 Tax=Bidens hawaiensis TaxID=980011 RepID=UPI00404AFA7D
MEFVHILTFLSLAMVASYAAVTPETYWKSVLPNTPMPKAISDLLHNDKSTNVQVGIGKGGVSVHAPGVNVGVGSGGVSVHAPGTNVGVGKGGGVSVHAPGTNVGDVKATPKGNCEKVDVGKGGVIVRCHNKKKPIDVEVAPFSYKYAATDDQLKDDPNVALFFLEKDMHQGNAMNLHFTKTTSPSSTFLPRKVANTIPFSSKKLPELYTRFSIKPNTVEFESMKKTIDECEDKGMEGEKKYCATSLEAMVDFSTSELGKKVKAVSTEVNARKSTPLQKYTIVEARKLASDVAVVCHKQNYQYAVFYCHKTITIKAYVVSLLGVDGTKAKAAAVCHTDTAKWNPKHLAFRVLKVKQGTTPVCHFLPEDHVVWVPY